jgi:hypothetical protein
MGSAAGIGSYRNSWAQPTSSSDSDSDSDFLRDDVIIKGGTVYARSGETEWNGNNEYEALEISSQGESEEGEVAPTRPTDDIGLPAVQASTSVLSESGSESKNQGGRIIIDGGSVDARADRVLNPVNNAGDSLSLVKLQLQKPNGDKAIGQEVTKGKIGGEACDPSQFDNDGDSGELVGYGIYGVVTGGKPLYEIPVQQQEPSDEETNVFSVLALPDPEQDGPTQYKSEDGMLYFWLPDLESGAEEMFELTVGAGESERTYYGIRGAENASDTVGTGPETETGTYPVVTMLQSLEGVVSISGEPKAGGILTATASVSNNDFDKDKLTYAWYIGKEKVGESDAYTIREDDLGKELYVAVESSEDYYKSSAWDKVIVNWPSDKPGDEDDDDDNDDDNDDDKDKDKDGDSKDGNDQDDGEGEGEGRDDGEDEGKGDGDSKDDDDQGKSGSGNLVGSPSYSGTGPKPPAAPGIPEGDVGGNAADPVSVHEPYIRGYGDGTFRPDSALTRAEFAEIFFRVTDLGIFGAGKAVPAFPAFADVKPGAWFGPAVSALAAGGVVEGYGDGTFRPASSVTRSELTAAMVRAGGLPQKLPEDGFTDVPAGYWAAGYIGAAESAGWVVGDAGGGFRPGDSVSRAEAVTAINRMLGRRPPTALPKDLLSPYVDINSSNWAYTDVIEASVRHGFTVDGGTEVWSGY